MFINESESALLEKFIKASQDIGKNKAYVQGAGGNTSLKINEEIIAVKSSGFELADISVSQGLSYLKYKEIIDYYNQNPQTTSQQFNEVVYKSASQFNNFKPSIETSFHCLIPKKIVIHTHSIYANILTCSVEGKDIALELFDCVWIPYKTPGIELAIEIMKALQQKQSRIIFLENHGLIITADSVEEAVNLHEEVNSKICQKFNLEELNNNYEILDMDYIRNNILFPDQIVYSTTDKFINTKAAIEVLTAYSYMVNNIEKCNLTLKCLDKNHVDIINNMDSEKYRQSLIKN
ncbi:MAG: class II aldolase/adducin family protein [Alphaproteobacteria bacterium]|jgi:rhamnose utilization protein RhaD (predicted bifunctional aldolase and dehydrogenase)|nr:class II aldolase/adducin family protein [Alphaproteobacteria bacterium]